MIISGRVQAESRQEAIEMVNRFVSEHPEITSEHDVEQGVVAMTATTRGARGSNPLSAHDLQEVLPPPQM